MWVEAVVLREDLDQLLAQFAPVGFAVGAGHLRLTDAAPCVIVPGVGVRVMCKAHVRWPVLGLDVPLTVDSLSVLLKPEIADDAHALVFKLEIENVDVAVLPKIVDDRIMEKVNEELVRKDVGLRWDFGRTLTHAFHLPATIEPLDALELTVLEGCVRIRSDGLGLAVRFGAKVTRHVDAPAADAP